MMKKFRITVNGNAYEVDVEELGAGMATSSGMTQMKPTQPDSVNTVAQPVEKKEVTTDVGSIKIEAPMQGKIIDVKVVEGQRVEDGDVIVILEAMKMENEIIASQAGVVTTLHVTTGQAVEAGDVIASLK